MGVQAISAEFRGTSVFAPIVTVRDTAPKKSKGLVKSSWHNIHHALRPLYGRWFAFWSMFALGMYLLRNLLSFSATVIIETSSKWPRDNYQAFFHMRRLFLLRIKELLVHIGVPSRIVSSGMLDVFIVS